MNALFHGSEAVALDLALPPGEDAAGFFGIGKGDDAAVEDAGAENIQFLFERCGDGRRVEKVGGEHDGVVSEPGEEGGERVKDECFLFEEEDAVKATVEEVEEEGGGGGVAELHFVVLEAEWDGVFDGNRGEFDCLEGLFLWVEVPLCFVGEQYEEGKRRIVRSAGFRDDAG
jgi:hypothetical protein